MTGEPMTIWDISGFRRLEHLMHASDSVRDKMEPQTTLQTQWQDSVKNLCRKVQTAWQQPSPTITAVSEKVKAKMPEQ